MPVVLAQVTAPKLWTACRLKFIHCDPSHHHLTLSEKCWKCVTSSACPFLVPETKPHGAEGSGEGTKLPVSSVMASAAEGKRETGNWGEHLQWILEAAQIKKRRHCLAFSLSTANCWPAAVKINSSNFFQCHLEI